MLPSMPFGSLPAASSCTLSCIGTLLNGSSVSNSSIKGWTCVGQHAHEAAVGYVNLAVYPATGTLPEYSGHAFMVDALTHFIFCSNAPNFCLTNMQASCNEPRAPLPAQLQTATAVLPASSWKPCTNLLKVSKPTSYRC